MSFLEKVYLGHSAFKDGFRLTWRNKRIVFYTMVLAVLSSILVILPFLFCRVMPDPELWLKFVIAPLPSDPISYVCIGLMRIFFLMVVSVIAVWSTAVWIRFILAYVRNKSMSFLSCFKFDCSTAWQIVGIGLLDAFLLKIFYSLCGRLLPSFNLVLSLICTSILFVLKIALLFVVDQAPGIWPAFKRAGIFIWNSWLSILMSIMEWTVFCAGLLAVIVPFILVCTISSDMAGFYLSLMSVTSSLQAFANFLKTPFPDACFSFLGIIISFGVFFSKTFMWFAANAMYASLYNRVNRADLNQIK